MRPSVIEARAHRRAQRESRRGSHPMRWFTLLPFISGEVLHRWAVVHSRCCTKS